jgi:hypothetical protein
MPAAPVPLPVPLSVCCLPACVQAEPAIPSHREDLHPAPLTAETPQPTSGIGRRHAPALLPVPLRLTPGVLCLQPVFNAAVQGITPLATLYHLAAPLAPPAADDHEDASTFQHAFTLRVKTDATATLGTGRVFGSRRTRRERDWGRIENPSHLEISMRPQTLSLAQLGELARVSANAGKTSISALTDANERISFNQSY